MSELLTCFDACEHRRVPVAKNGSPLPTSGARKHQRQSTVRLASAVGRLSSAGVTPLGTETGWASDFFLDCRSADGSVPHHEARVPTIYDDLIALPTPAWPYY